MKLLFVHDAERLKEDKEGNFYTDGAYNIEVWNRYLSISNNLSVIFRKDKEKYEVKYAKNKFNIVKNGIRFIEVIDRKASIKEYFNLKSIKLNSEIIKRAVWDCDSLIVRLPCDAGYTAIKYAKKYDKPYFIEVVGCIWDAYWNYNLKGKILALNSYLRMRKVVKNAPYAIYVTNEFLQRRYPCKGKKLGCSDVSLPTLDPGILKKRLNKINNMLLSKPIVLGTTASVGVKYKGQEYVIKAIAKLNKEGYNFEYHLAGGGDNSYLKTIAEEMGISDKVKFLGILPHKEVFEYLDNVDIYIQPSKQEGLPRALVEAMSRGCPSLGSTTGGIPELLNDRFIFENGDVNEICKLLKIMDKKVMIEEAKRSFQKAKLYDKEILDKNRMDFYCDFLKCNIISN